MFWNFNQAIVVKLPDYLDNNINESFNKAINKAGFRNIETNPFWLDKFFKNFYKKLDTTIFYSKEKKNINNCINITPLYLTVDITSDIVRVTEEMENIYFYNLLNKIESEIKYKKIEALILKTRILLRKKNARPVVFYEKLVFNIHNIFNKRLYSVEKKINFQPNMPSGLTILGFAGDVVIEEYVKYSIKKNGGDYTFKELRDILKTPDIMSINLEFVISERGKKEEKHFTFRANEKQFKIITHAPIDYTCNANNHAMDYGEISLLDTIKYLNKYGIHHSGSGKNIEKAFAPARIFKNFNSLLYFSICEVSNEKKGYETMKHFKAKKNKPGIAYFDNKILSNLFKKEKNKGNINIIQFHTGSEHALKPSKRHKYRARKLIDIGADVVICHHPHVINGIEIYKNKLIAYSLGDFLFDIQKKNADQGILLFLFVKENKILTWAFYPTVSHYGAVILEEKRIRDVEKRFIRLTEDLLRR
ncbi:MAG: CapA family protein [Spirochaetes bacterium]|nr:CapA family protein [Spirochaetota bacterium]